VRDPAGQSLLKTIQERGGIGVDERIDAYRANVRGAHLNALDQVFQVTREVLGERYWRQLLEQEIEVFASTSPDLHAYGEFVSSLLQTAQQSRPELEDLPYLHDLATLEWQVHCVRFTFDDPHFDWNAFAALAPDLQSRAILRPGRALKVFRSRYPVDVIWHAHQAATGAAPGPGSPAVCCIHRANRFDVTVTRLASESANLLEAIGNGISLDELSETENLKTPEAMIRQIYDWIQCGWIIDFEVR
jgi:hypothetical protein